MNSPRRDEPVGTESLFRNHAPFVARMLARLGVGSDELDDAVQEVFLVVHRRGGYMPGPATPAGYLASIAVRVAASRRRRMRRTRERASAVAPDEVSALGDPARSCEAREELAVVQEALDRLDPDLRMTLVLAELEGESCKQIAAMLRIPVGTVYWRLHQARKTFRSAMGIGALGVEGAEPANDGLGAARAQALVVYDVAGGLSRLGDALHVAAGAKAALLPAWAEGAARVVALAGRAGLAHPAVLSVVASLTLLPGTPPSHVAGPSAASAPTRTLASALGERASQGLRSQVAVEALEAAPASELGSESAPAPALRPSPVAASRHPSAVPAAFDEMREIQQVATAHQLLDSSPAQALSLVEDARAHFAAGYMQEERRYIGVAALFKLGRSEEARAQAARFLADYPDGPYSERVRVAVRRSGG